MPSSRPSRLPWFFLALVVGAGVAIWFGAMQDPEDPKARRSGPFLATPYLQLGEDPKADALTLLWHAEDRDAPWTVEVRSPLGAPWRPGGKPDARPVKLDGVEPHRIYRAVLAGLAAGEAFRYRVLLGGKPEFEATARARPAPGRAHRFVAFGDCAANTPGQKRVAYQAYLADPDFALITGDIVYFQGRVGEYRGKYFPIYAAARPSPDLGAPLLGSVPFVAVPGNHDLMINDFGKNADLMAYFYFWSQPLNGPVVPAGSKIKLAPKLKGDEARQKAFRDLAGANFPRMANFSFDSGDVHWTVLDANPYVQWADPTLRAWVEADLASARAMPWRFVAFHQPGFNSAKVHADEQQTRLLADVFERGGVSIAFSGHVHNYQRTYPLTFAARTHPDGRAPEPSTPVAGAWTLDKDYDGTANTTPRGVIYLVTGAGGAKLYNPEQTRQPETWQPFTRKFVADVHSLTIVDITPDTATVRQVDADGGELDRFVIRR